MRMRWHRSLTLWAGIIVLASMIWAWVDSAYNSSGIVVGFPGNRQFNFGQLKQTLRITCYRMPTSGGFAFSSGRVEIRGHEFSGPEPVNFFLYEKGPAGTSTTGSFYMAWWVPIAAFLPLWAGLLYWRYRRHAKAAVSYQE